VFLFSDGPAVEEVAIVPCPMMISDVPFGGTKVASLLGMATPLYA